MRTIKAWELEIKLNLGDPLTVWDTRKIVPILNECKENWLELMIQIVLKFCDQSELKTIEEKIDNLDVMLLPKLIEDVNEITAPIQKAFDKKKS